MCHPKVTSFCGDSQDDESTKEKDKDSVLRQSCNISGGSASVRMDGRKHARAPAGLPLTTCDGLGLAEL